MIQLKKKYVIGCHVMFYEIEIYKEYIDGIVNMLQDISNKENIYLDLCFNISEKIEKIDISKISKEELIKQFNEGIERLKQLDISNIITRVITPEDDFYFALSIAFKEYLENPSVFQKRIDSLMENTRKVNFLILDPLCDK